MKIRLSKSFTTCISNHKSTSLLELDCVFVSLVYLVIYAQLHTCTATFTSFTCVVFDVYVHADCALVHTLNSRYT